MTGLAFLLSTPLYLCDVTQGSTTPVWPHLIQPPLPALLPFDHQLDAVGQRGEDPRRGGFEGDGLALEINAVCLLKGPL